ncbi:hypothetical protein N7E81_14180 [Reichenbachiella carrageenanivorans]|uniref:Uncharacterized protein n=1 Tax=Reichenbachiella carrageenanivorans TaxID=2979869 RepID=A0ABY6CX57_9BACT|nr:hypothetical protein [Reichenbachiella carrageenanivorans]UXX78506.1 hypothetical protein N7E81_14180 [Reichenbachiella carrageenanivorans]
MRLYYLLFVLLIVLANTSCEKSRDDGDWDDNIHLSTRELILPAIASSGQVTTKGDWWWVSEIHVDNQSYYDFEGVDLEFPGYSIKRDSITVTRSDVNTLDIQLGKNPEATFRVFIISLQAGNYFDYVKVTQEGSK